MVAARLSFGVLRELPIPDPSRFARLLPEIVELGSPHFPLTNYLDSRHDRRMDRKDPLDPDPERHLADGEGFAVAPALAGDHRALENLDALLLAFDHLGVDSHGVPDLERRQRLLAQRSLETLQPIHVTTPPPRTSRTFLVLPLARFHPTTVDLPH